MAAKLKQDCIFELGEGKRIRFWEDVWCGESPICTMFPTLYSIVVARGAKVAEVWESSGDSGAWNPRFLRPLNDWEMEQVQNFIG